MLKNNHTWDSFLAAKCAKLPPSLSKILNRDCFTSERLSNFSTSNVNNSSNRWGKSECTARWNGVQFVWNSVNSKDHDSNLDKKFIFFYLDKKFIFFHRTSLCKFWKHTTKFIKTHTKHSRLSSELCSSNTYKCTNAYCQWWNSTLSYQQGLSQWS